MTGEDRAKRRGRKKDDAKLPAPLPRRRRGEDRASEGLPQYVTPLLPMEMQVGQHIIKALQHPKTVAVLTTVALGADGQQRIISVGLDQDALEHVQSMVQDAESHRTERVPCVGFHCYVKDPEDTGKDTKAPDTRSEQEP
jgi:hypothetical protein